MVHVLQTTENVIISRCWFVEDGKDMNQELWCTCTTTVLLIGHAFYVIGLKNIRIHPSTRYRILCIYIFSTLESELIFFRIRCRIRRIRVDGSRIRKEKVADSKISGYVWTGREMIVHANRAISTDSWLENKTKELSLANHKGQTIQWTNQISKQIFRNRLRPIKFIFKKNTLRRKASRENVCEPLAVGFGFTSHTKD